MLSGLTSPQTPQANLLAFVRYKYEGDIHEDFLFSKPLPSQCTAEKIFETLNGFMLSNRLGKGCVGLSTDGARAMAGKLSGVVKQVKDVSQLSTAVSTETHWLSKRRWQF